jgi:outer membrane lipoprotein SlyB
MNEDKVLSDMQSRPTRPEGTLVGLGLVWGAGTGSVVGLIVAGGTGLALGGAAGAGLGIVLGAVLELLTTRRQGPQGR